MGSESTMNQYLNARNSFMEMERKLSVNSAWELSEEEQLVDELISNYKLSDAKLDPNPVQFNFVAMRDTIDRSPLFSLLESFPKGALLHSHDTSTQSMYYFVNATYLPGCLYSLNEGEDYGYISFIPTDGYVPIASVREGWPGGMANFDAELYLNFTILRFEDQLDTTGDFLWQQFQPIFSRVDKLYHYKPVLEGFYPLVFEKLFNDGIYRIEMRTSLANVYDDEKTYSEAESLQIILNQLDLWKKRDPEARDIFSVGFILQGIRSSSIEEVTTALKNAYTLRDQFPDVIKGFDLVGHEDEGETLLYWAPTLIKVQEELLAERNNQNTTTSSISSWSTPYEALPFFFHAGESNRATVQINLVDAVFLNTTRIGHGFGIQEYPALWTLLKTQDILIESCPISNQLLGLVVDQRNHPVGQMLQHTFNYLPAAAAVAASTSIDIYSEGDILSQRVIELLNHDNRLKSLFSRRLGRAPLSVSINNDDPGFWGIDGTVSYDWYVAVLAWDLSLGGMKQVALDSIVHSTASLSERAELLLRWKVDYESWMEATIKSMHTPQ